MNTKIEQCVEDICSFINSCRSKKFSQSSQIIVDKNEMDDLLAALKVAIPDDIKKYHNLVQNQQEIIADAKQKADSILETAKNQTNQMLNEHEIIQEAYKQAGDLINNAEFTAKEIVNKAHYDANSIRMSAISYTDEMLANLANIINATVEESGKKYEDFIKIMREAFNSINENRKNLEPDAQQAQAIKAIEEMNEINNHNISNASNAKNN